MNHLIMERCAMFKNHVVHGKTSGLVLGFPMLLRRILFPQKERKDMNHKPDPERGVRAEKKGIVF